MPDGPGRFPQGSSCPAVLRSHREPVRVFAYRAVTSFGRPFQAVRLTLPVPPSRRSPAGRGPTTPGSPRGSPGLGCSDFARHYCRNHGCFLFLRVLRWFTSPGAPRAAMDSPHDSRCSHRLGSPIRTSPDHSLLAAPRGLSQLAASFLARLRLGIHTHALSSLTIKFTPDTGSSHGRARTPAWPCAGPRAPTCALVARPYSVVKDPPAAPAARRSWWAWVELNYRPHPYQGCALAT